MTPENLRYHAAGHLAGAVALIDGGELNGARVLLRTVKQYVDAPQVDAPPQLKEKLRQAAMDPERNRAGIVLLEQWFVDPFNTTIEKSGGKFGGE